MKKIVYRLFPSINVTIITYVILCLPNILAKKNPKFIFGNKSIPALNATGGHKFREILFMYNAYLLT